MQKDTPSDKFIRKLGDKLNGDYSLDAIYKACNAKTRKHIVYIWCELNKKPHLIILPQHKEHILKVIQKLATSISGRLPSYIYLIKLICEKYKYTYILPYLYVKNKSIKCRDILYNHI